MSENAAPQEQAAAATEATEQQAPAAETPKPADTVEFWKSKAREQEKRAKDNATAAARLKEIEDATKSESERATERLTAAETRAAEAQARADRLEVAFAKGLTPAQAKRLVGGTREELEADADEILRDFPTTPAGPVRPTGDIGQGPRTPAAITDPRARDLAQIEADLKAGARR